MMCTPGNRLNRSSSESDLHKSFSFDNLTVQDHYVGFEKKTRFVTKKILYVEEIIHTDSPEYLRRAACYGVLGQSTPDHLHNLESLSVTSILNNTFNNKSMFISNVKKHFGNVTPKDGLTCIDKDDIVPMEVDALQTELKTEDCVNFVETMDIDSDANYTNSRYSNFDNLIKKRNKKITESPNVREWSLSDKGLLDNRTTITAITQLKKKNSRYNTCLLTLVILISTLLYVVCFHDVILYVNSDVQYNQIQRDLLENVHGQNASLNIVKTLQQRDHWKNKIKVLSFIGSTGVGKTFVANIIKKHFHEELTHELYGVHLSYKSHWNKILDELRSCCLNLIVIDDLKRKDTTDLFALIHSLPQNQFILVISIFNIQYTDNNVNHTINYKDIIEIRNEFDNSGIYHEIIIFEEFNNDRVKNWIEKQLKLQNVDFQLQQQIVKTVLKGHEVKYEGLKGLHSKLLLELEKHSH